MMLYPSIDKLLKKVDSKKSKMVNLKKLEVELGDSLLKKNK